MRLIDADEVLKHIDAYWGTCQRIRKPRNGETAVMLDVKAIIEARSAVDAVPVVRCRDCKFLRLTGTVWKCQNRLVMMLCEPNDYCSRGERHDKD